MQVGHVAVYFGRYDFLPPVTFHCTGFAYPDGRCCGLRGDVFSLFLICFRKAFCTDRMEYTFYRVVGNYNATATCRVDHLGEGF